MKDMVERFPDRWERVYSDDIVKNTGERLEQAFEIYERVHRKPVVMEPDTGSASIMPLEAPQGTL